MSRDSRQPSNPWIPVAPELLVTADSSPTHPDPCKRPLRPGSHSGGPFPVILGKAQEFNSPTMTALMATTHYIVKILKSNWEMGSNCCPDGWTPIQHAEHCWPCWAFLALGASTLCHFWWKVIIQYPVWRVSVGPKSTMPYLILIK